MLMSDVLSGSIKYIRGIRLLLFAFMVLMQCPVDDLLPKGAGKYCRHQ